MDEAAPRSTGVGRRRQEEINAVVDAIGGAVPILPDGGVRGGSPSSI
jgi:hypothetical protein